MPSKDFSRGYPRNGQWVTIDDKYIAICQGPATHQHTVSEDPMSGQMVVKALPPQGSVLVPVDLGNLFQVDIVDNTGFKTVIQIFCSVSRLKPITERGQIPADRLATYDPNWIPVP